MNSIVRGLGWCHKRMIDKSLVYKRAATVAPSCAYFRSPHVPQKSAYIMPCMSCPILSTFRGTCPIQSNCPILNQKVSFYSSKMNGRPPTRCVYCRSPLQDTKLLLNVPIFCSYCSRLQPPNQTDITFFDLLNDGEVSFIIDLSKVKRNFLKLQRSLHPDQFRGELSEASKASDWSAYVNRGYEILRSPLYRAIYMV